MTDAELPEAELVEAEPLKAEFLETVRGNPVNAAILDRLPELGAPQAQLVAGCLFGAVWNAHSGRPLAPGVKTDLFLFVTDRNATPDVPASKAPTFTQVNKLLTASWSRNGRIYILAAPGDAEFLKKFL